MVALDPSLSAIVLCGNQSDASSFHRTAHVDGNPFPVRTNRPVSRRRIASPLRCSTKQWRPRRRFSRPQCARPAYLPPSPLAFHLRHASEAAAAAAPSPRAGPVYRQVRRPRGGRGDRSGGGGRRPGSAAGGGGRQAELLIPQLEFLNEEGAQDELWALSRIFLDTLVQETGQVWIPESYCNFPRCCAAALLKYQWKDAQFKCFRGYLEVQMSNPKRRHR
ncbi:uncharacterized protein LOC133930871 [Phragmites australis]|uniref:uncharacterized protein LOC133930871 n=1 Tax=Phragmites australis TaxID=29695 RepID=UPI002D79F3E8|nr:uncharacterized protein LOC133930871 [Phragmites australis]